MSTAVLLSNFPQEYTEERLGELARSVGPILKLKLAFDENTGRSRSLCVVQYQDLETASSAARNLNGYNLENGRTMKCVYVDDDEIKKLFPQDYSVNDNSNSKVDKSTDVLGKMLNGMDKEVQLLKQIPPLPRGITLPNGSNLDNLNTVIYNSLMSLDKSRLENLLKEAHELASEFPELTKVLLKTNPQLQTALIQGALLLDVATPEDIKNLMIEQLKDEEEQEYEPQAEQRQQTTQQAKEDLSELPAEQQEMIKTILNMSQEDIMAISDPQQQQLYIEIQKRFSS